MRWLSLVLVALSACAASDERAGSGASGDLDAGACRQYHFPSDVRLALSPPLQAWSDWSYEGPAIVTSAAPLAITFSDGRRFEIQQPALSIPLGARLHVELMASRYWQNGVAYRFGVWATRGGARGRLAFAAWEDQELRGWSFGDAAVLGVEPAGAVCPVGCLASRQARAYRVRVGSQEVRVEDTAQVGDYAVRAWGYGSEGWLDACSDGPPPSLHMGWIVGAGVEFETEPEVVDCGGLHDAACLAHEACTLHGGDGVPYRCVPALAGCESISSGAACAAEASCVWQQGDCFCPARTACECEGGPAPGCREACLTGEPCSQDGLRFCQAVDATDLSCARLAAGWCARRADPSECSFGGPYVCGCQLSFRPAWRRGSACERAADGAPFVAPATSAACD